MWSLALGLALMSNEPPPQVADPEPPRGRVAVGLGIAGLVAGTPMMLVGGVFSLYSGVPVPGSNPPPIGRSCSARESPPPLSESSGSPLVHFGTKSGTPGKHATPGARVVCSSHRAAGPDVRASAS